MSGIHYISNRTSTHLPSFAPLSCGSGSSPCSHHLLTILCHSCGFALLYVVFFKVKYISSRVFGPVFHRITLMGRFIFSFYQNYGFRCHVLPTECLLSTTYYATLQFIVFSLMRLLNVTHHLSALLRLLFLVQLSLYNL